MSNDLAVSMDELERESAELLPSRETLCVCRCSYGHSSSFTQVGTATPPSLAWSTSRPCNGSPDNSLDDPRGTPSTSL